MRRWARRSSAVLLAALLAGCASEEPKPKPQPQPQPRATTAPAEAPPPDDGGVVIKGSKPRADSAPRSDDGARRGNQARIDELKRKAGEGGSTSNWQEYSSEEGRYRMLFPGPPTPGRREFQGPNGVIVLNNQAYAAKAPDKRVFLASWCEWTRKPEETDDKVLEQITLGQGVGTGGKVVEVRAIEHDTHAGREIRIDCPNDMTVRSRVFVVGSRLYQLIVVVPTGEAGSRDLFKFLESFKLTR